MKVRKVSIALLSWNGRHHLEICLPALAEQLDAGVASEVLVLDNGSHDGTAEWVRRRHPEVRLITSPVNLGFCAGNNRLAAEAEGDALVLLNNDTRPESGWLAALVDALSAAADDVAAVSGQIVDWTGERLDFAEGILTFDGHAFQKDFGRPLAGVRVPAAGSELLFACGGNMIVWRQAFLAAGGFDEDYFAYLEDVDLGWRLWLGGARVIFAPEAVVRHRSMATSALLGNAHRGFLFERNAFMTAYKNYEDEILAKLLPPILLTLTHRTQTLMVQNNPGGEQLTFNPYAGLIANTAHPAPPQAGPPQAEGPVLSGPSPPRHGLWQKWCDYGPREFARRAVRKALTTALPDWALNAPPPTEPRLSDDRTVSQLRAVTQLLGSLDRVTERRREVQGRRRRSDREIFERFPLYVVPTYPGDERLFQSPSFRAWMGDEPAVVYAAFDEIMQA